MRQAGGVFVCLVALWIWSTQARADDNANPGGLGVGLSIGTTGVGGELSVRPIGNLVLRAGGGWFALDHDFTVDGNVYKLKADMVSAGAAIDWHPFSNGFRLSAGGRYHNVDFTGKGDFSGATVTLNGTTYNLATIGTVTANVKSSNTIAPYLGLGYDSTHFSDSRWAFAFDLGVIYGGKPTSTLTAQNEAAVTGLRADLDAEQKKLDDSVGKYGQFWPVATLALKFRF
jgi:hypothetical protein